jgi:hypothetical protein
MTFEEKLYQTLQNTQPLSLQQGRLMRAMENAPGTTPRIVAALEERVRRKLGIDPDAAVDWSAGTFDWNTILQIIEALLPILIALLGGF